jgi:phosphoglycolate phosphatase-like HAD superfamily hydrolase
MMLIDFDGTIVDLWPRYHAVFCALTNAKIDLQTYKSIKRVYKRDGDLAQHLGMELLPDYFARKRVLLEDPAYLALDQLLVSREKLCRFMKQRDACILTARRNPENFLWELDHLGLSELRERAICISGPKTQWVENLAPSSGIIIGDDIRDLQVIMVSKMNAVMVQTGLHTQEDFCKTGLPHELVRSLEEFIDRG